jgi:hypothetical protein
VLFQLGGPSQLDTFDMKPDAPTEVRGEFRPIATSVAGTTICEHLPLLARQMHRVTVIRTVSHKDSQHNNAGYATLTGFHPPPVEALATPRPDDHPAFGAVLTKLRPSPVPWVSLPFESTNLQFSTRRWSFGSASSAARPRSTRRPGASTGLKPIRYSSQGAASEGA